MGRMRLLAGMAAVVVSANRRARPARWTRPAVSVLLTVTVVVSLLPGGVAVAEEAGGGVEPVVFEPAATDTSAAEVDDPVGGFNVKSSHGGEVVALRKATSRTFAEDGALKTVVWPGPVNYLDLDGSYKPIDNRLLVGVGGGITNTANSYRVNFPAELTTAPATITTGQHRVSYTLRDAGATVGVVDEDAVDYEEPMPGVQRLQYRAENARVSQAFDVPVEQAPESVAFELTTDPGLTATQTAAGGIVFVDGSGGVAMAVTDPVVEDPQTGLPVDGSGGGILLEQISETTYLVTVLVREVIDAVLDSGVCASSTGSCAPGGKGNIGPIVTVRAGITLSPWQDCILIAAAPDDSFCGYANLDIGYTGSSTRRTVIDFATARTGLPDNAEVLHSKLAMYRYDYVGSATATIDVHPMTGDWTTATTWNSRDGITPWATPGGDFSPTVGASTSISTTSDGWVTWHPTALVQDWIDRDVDDFGFMVKDATEADSSLQRFISGNYVGQSYWPYLEVIWEPRMGVRSDYAFEEWQLSDRITAKVNVANGNLVMAQRDIIIPGTGLDLTLDRTFNSLGVYSTELGARWAFDTGRDIGLRRFADGSVALYGPGFDVTVFDRNPDGSFTSPGDANATLTKTKHGYQLNFHRSGETWKFSDGGFFLERRDKNGNTVKFAYDSDGRLTTITDTQGRVTTFTHKKDQLVSVTDPAGRTHQYRYADGGLVEYVDPAGGSTFYKYEGDLDLRAITDPSGRVTEFTYDDRDRVTSLTRYEGKTADSLTSNTWRFAYNDTDHTTTVTDPNLHSTTYHHDNRARVEKTVDARGNERSNGYDSNSNVTDYTTAAGTTTTFDYDTTTNNLTKASLPTGAATQLFYDDPAHPYLPSKQIDMQSNATGYTYDAAGNVDTVTDAETSVIDYDYNPDGTLARKVDAKGNVTRYAYTYSPQGVLETVSVDHPAPLGDIVQRFDSLGRLTSVTDGNAQTTEYGYDALDRPTTINYADTSTISFTYDPAGNRLSMTDQLGTTSYSYDGMARLLQEQLGTGQPNVYTYDGVGNLLTHTDPTGTTTYTYNPVNLVDTLTDPAGNATEFGYTLDNQRDVTAYPNGVTMRSHYDDAGRLERIWSTGPDGTLTDFSYTYTHPTIGADTALRWTMSDATRGETTAYDYTASNRLETATLTGPAGSSAYSYTYDPNGNRTTKAVNGATTSYTYNAADQLTKDSTGTTYTYDGTGNLTESSDGAGYAYNAKNQTTTITPAGGPAIGMGYTGPSQVGRVSAGATDFDLTILGTTTSTTGGQAAGYTRDPSGGLVSTTRGTATYYYLFDGLGSVVGLTDATGELVNEYRYSPYGLTTLERETVTNPWRFTGQHHDQATGLYKIGHRYYNPDHARWTQPDPSGREGNVYLYAGANPVNLTDPTGLFAFGFDEASFVLGVLAGIAGIAGAPALAAGLTAASILAGIAGAFVGPCTAEAIAFEVGYGILGSGLVGSIAAAGARGVAVFAEGFLAGFGYTFESC